MKARATAARAVVAATLVLWGVLTTSAHDFSKNPVSWNREISRLVYDRCASCHREGGSAFSLMSFQEAQPRAFEIRDAVLSRRMPPWGAVKGFGNFRNDSSLTQEQVELVAAWVEGGMRKGNNPNVIPDAPKFEPPTPFRLPSNSISIKGTVTLQQPVTLDGVLAQGVPAGASMQVTALAPGGRVIPLVWLYEYRDEYQHPFLYRRPIALPAGTTILGVRPPATLQLLLAK